MLSQFLTTFLASIVGREGVSSNTSISLKFSHDIAKIEREIVNEINPIKMAETTGFDK